jgi:hypothetical protein
MNFDWVNAGTGPGRDIFSVPPFNFHRWDANLDVSVTDGVTPGSGQILSRLRFKANADNGQPKNFKVFFYVDPLVNVTASPSNNGELLSATRSAAGVSASWTQPGTTDVVNLLATGSSPFAVQLGEGSNTTSGTPLRNIVQGNTSTPMTALTDLVENTPTLTYTSGPLGAGMGIEWSFTLNPGQSSPELFVALAYNQTPVIPEPATLGAIAAGAVLMLRRRG